MAEIIEATDLETTLALLSTARGAVRVRSNDEHPKMRLIRNTVGPIGIGDWEVRHNPNGP